MQEFFSANPISGLILTLGSFWFGQYLYKKTGWSFLQPVLVSGILIIIFLKVFHISYQEYYDKNVILNFLLPVTAVAMAVPLFRNLHILRQNALPIFIGIFMGTITTMGSMIALGRLMGTDSRLLLSMLPKNATNPIAMEVSAIIGGIPALTVALVVLAGTIGTVMGPEIMNVMRIKNKVARGIAIGSMSHAVGTARAFKESEIEGSMSSLAMALAGTMVAVLSPIMALFIK